MIRKKLVSCVIALAMLACVPAFASTDEIYDYDVPESGISCSLSVTLSVDETAIEGADISIYKVADYQEDGGSVSYVLVDEYSECDVDFEDMTAAESEDAAILLSEIESDAYASSSTDSAGYCSFEIEDYGMYLVVQTNLVDGYENMTPYLVQVPLYNEDDGSWTYGIDSVPKSEIKETSSDDTTPKKTTNVQTDEISLPYILAVATGIVIALIIVLIVMKKKKEKNQ